MRNTTQNEGHAAIRQNVQQNAAFNSAFVTMNALAAVIASYGLLVDSSAVVIAAMIVALLLDPLMGIALALVDANNRLLKTALLAELGGVAIVYGISLIIGAIHQDIPLGRTIISRTVPNNMDMAVALAGGAAGAYATISPRVSVSLVGVAIATALVPPLCVSGLMLARGETQLAYGGFLLFIANLVAIQIAASVVLWLHGYHKITTIMRTHWRVLPILHGPSVVLLAVLILILGLNFRHTLAMRNFEIQVRGVLNRQIQSHPGSYLADLRIEEGKHRTTVMAVVRTPFSFAPKRVALIQSKIPTHRPPVELHIRSIITTEATARGWLHQPPVAPLQIDAESSRE